MILFHSLHIVPAGSVVVISTPSSAVNAVWGGLMAARAKRLGAVGVVIDGLCRDVEELRQRGLPVFSRGRSILGAAGYTRVSTCQQPITVDGCTIEPDDIIVGDEDGVIAIPTTLVEQVKETAAKLVAADEKCLTDILNGSSVQDAFKRHRG